MKTKYTSIMMGFLLFLTLFSCKDEKEDTIKEINPNIVNISDQKSFDHYLRNCPTALWISDSIIAVSISLVTIGNDFNVTNSTPLAEMGVRFLLCANAIRNKFLLLPQPDSRDEQSSLKEWTTNTNNVETILNGIEHITGAAYYKNGEQIIYCSYQIRFNTDGTINSLLDNYYLYDRNTKDTTFIISYSSLYETYRWFVNGFDIHLAKNTLLIPIKGVDNTSSLVEYNMDTKKADTLEFILPYPTSWLRYNRAGDKILYSSASRYESEIGIIDMKTRTKKILDVNTSVFGTSINLFPNWSADEKHIIYSSTKYTKDGAISIPSLYILKNIYSQTK